VVFNVITWVTGVVTIKRPTMTAYGCLIAGQGPVAVGLAYCLETIRSSACDTTALLQLQLLLVALYKCYAVTFLAHLCGMLKTSGVREVLQCYLCDALVYIICRRSSVSAT